jgi:Asp-tRNA(Asn)/Glu-tRNA(Gln) amidotransferase A subunit family amidase
MRLDRRFLLLAGHPHLAAPMWRLGGPPAGLSLIGPAWSGATVPGAASPMRRLYTRDIEG